MDAFSFDYRRYLHWNPLMDGFGRMRRTLRDVFYAADDSRLLSIAAEFDIDYILFRRNFIKHQTGLPIVCENEDFLICSTKRPES